VFTLPICLRDPTDPGYPPSDAEVYQYFSTIHKDNDLSHSVHVAVVCFLAACHMTMLAWLKDAMSSGKEELLAYWHRVMEREPKDRRKFFKQVVELAARVSHYHLSPS
jgi:hypothetical protein